MRPIIIGFGLLILCLLILFRLGEINFIKGDVKLEVIVSIAALVFFFVGLYFNYHSQIKSAQSRSPSATGKETSTTPVDYEQIKKLGITQREHDVLLKMAEGMSNQEIGAALFLSESTIKTHVSNILFKLDAKRRTQAVQMAKQLKIVP
jgi:DNA-binding NarL/FixJ family response regulator